MFKQINRDVYETYVLNLLYINLEPDIFSRYEEFANIAKIKKDKYSIHIETGKYTVSICLISDDYYLISVYETAVIRYNPGDKYFLCDQLDEVFSFLDYFFEVR